MKNLSSNVWDSKKNLNVSKNRIPVSKTLLLFCSKENYNKKEVQDIYILLCELIDYLQFIRQSIHLNRKKICFT